MNKSNTNSENKRRNKSKPKGKNKYYRKETHKHILKGAGCTSYGNRYPFNQNVLFRKCT